MFYVIGSENSKSGSVFFLLPPTEPPACVEQFGTFRSTESVSGRPDISQYGRTVYSVVYVAANRCATIIQTHHLSVKFLNASHYIRNLKEQFSTETKKDPSTG